MSYDFWKSGGSNYRDPDAGANLPEVDPVYALEVKREREARRPVVSELVEDSAKAVEMIDADELESHAKRIRYNG